MKCIVPRCQANTTHKAHITGFINLKVGYCGKHQSAYDRLIAEFEKLKKRGKLGKRYKLDSIS